MALNRSINIDYKTVRDLIAADRLREAASRLREMAGNGNFRLIEQLNRTETTYTYLLQSLQWLKDGRKDPERNRILNNIRESLFTILDEYYDEVVGKDSSSQYYTLRRLAAFSALNYSEAIGRYLSADASAQLQFDKQSKEYRDAVVSKNMALKDLFSIVLTMRAADLKKDIRSIENVIVDDDLSFSLRAVLIGGLIMKGLRRYSSEIFTTLLNIYAKASSEKIKARSAVGIALILDRFPARVAKDEDLQTRFELLADDLTFYTRMRETVYALARVRGAKKFNARIKEEILPDLQKMTPDFLKNIRNESGEIDLEKLEENPEWENIMSNTGIEKHIRKFSDMQNHGADMMLALFESVSGDPFFNDMDAWFRPYEPWEIDRLGLPEEFNSVMDLYALNPGACDSDKFAMLINMRRMPKQAMDMLKSTIEAQAQQINEEMKGFTLHSSIPEFELETYNFARTLYRFFNYFKHRAEFRNPFERALDLSAWPFVGEVFMQTEIISAVADFYFKQGFHEDAIRYYRMLADSSKDDKIRDLANQKIALAYERSGDLDNALIYFKTAALMNPEDEWVAKKIVRLGQKSGKLTSDLLQPLLLLHNKDKNDLTYLLPLADMEVSGKIRQREENAQPYKFLDRAVYVAPENPNVLRLILKKWLLAQDEPDSDNPDSARHDSEVKATVAALRNNVEMYLAARSLSDSIGGDGESAAEAGTAEELESMVEDEKWLMDYALAIDSIGDALEALHGMARLRNDKIDRREIERHLRLQFGNHPLRGRIASALPLLFDALG